MLRLLDDRTQMLAAISHDLRTPITRLRLRAEFIEDDRAREMTLRDLDQMNGLVESALSFVRDGQGSASEGEPLLIDLASVVQTVCDGFIDIGAAVSLERSRHVLVRGRPDDLERALTNLVDNAVKYGGGARILMGPARQSEPPGVAVEVLDDGPGIPEAERHAMLQPFVRGDRARNLNAATGFGLGLSIVLAIVEGHGGRLTLENRQGGGALRPHRTAARRIEPRRLRAPLGAHPVEPYGMADAGFAQAPRERADPACIERTPDQNSISSSSISSGSCSARDAHSLSRSQPRIVSR